MSDQLKTYIEYIHKAPNPLTVGALIEKLKKVPPDKLTAIEGCDCAAEVEDVLEVGKYVFLTRENGQK